MKVYIAPHSFSDGAKLLSEKLSGKTIKPEESNYKYKNDHVVINWGSSTKKNWFVSGIKMINSPDAVAKVVNKLTCLSILKDKGISIPEYYTSIQDAKNSVKNGNIIFCRTKTRSSGGDGIVVATEENEVVNAPLFTVYKKKKAEYRVAVVDGKVIDFMQKKKRSDWNVELQGPVDNYIRSHGRGWIFARENVNPPQLVLDLAVKSVKALGLDFGSVDIIFNESENKAYVLEINSAPGLEEGGTSLERYSNAFKQLLNNQTITELKTTNTGNSLPATAPTTNVVSAASVAVAPTPVVNNLQPVSQSSNNINSEIDLTGFSNIKMIKLSGNKIRVMGNIVGRNTPIRIMEISNGSVDMSF